MTIDRGLRAHRWLVPGRWRVPEVAGVILVLAGVPGCPYGVRLGTEPAPDAGPPPMPCGTTTCGAGEYCCNPSCSMCVPIDAVCVETTCGGECGPQRVQSDPSCGGFRSLGWAWNGAACVLLPGCGCLGEDCGSLYPTEAACVEAHAGCPSTRYCASSADCVAGELCQFSDGCGAMGTLGVCMPAPDACPPGVYEPVCGCDGIPHASPCEAAAAGYDVALSGPCDPCGAEDARVAAITGCFSPIDLGEFWNGSSCIHLMGCDCSGVDCPLGSRPPGDCAMRHAGCPPPPPYFPCGADGTMCTTFAEICVDGGPVEGTHCEPAPSDCPMAPRCDCPTLAMYSACSEDGAGGVYVTR